LQTTGWVVGGNSQVRERPDIARFVCRLAVAHRRTTVLWFCAGSSPCGAGCRALWSPAGARADPRACVRPGGSGWVGLLAC
jgi:hypothetical protein